MPTNSSHKISPQRVAELSKLARQIDREDAALIKSRARAVFRGHETLQKLIRSLKADREAQGLSLAEVGERSGIGKSNLSRLENDRAPNPTWETMARYAEALGRKLDVVMD